jgi:phosphoribosylamine--glycine ligase
MRVLVVGGGGREHALAWKLAGDPRVEHVLAAPGSAGIAEEAECVGVRADDVEGLARLASERGADLTMVGPEVPLALGIVDRFRREGLRIVGPGAEGARLEASKAFMKKVLTEAGVPTAAYGEFTDARAARAFARELGAPVVVKADGLASGKGVVVCADLDEADAAIRDMLERDRFGSAGRRVVVEEFLEGEEASFIVLTDGIRVVPLAPSQDHKAVGDGDRGPNTGGMGAYSPTPAVDAATADLVVKRLIEPTVAALRARGIDYRGVLYAGLMMTRDGPKVLEYNVRFGDPETQPLMMRMRGGFADLLEACAEGDLSSARVAWDAGAAVCVVMAAGGYPGDVTKGDVITGIEDAERQAHVKVFHAGTRRDDAGLWRTDGGRVLGVTAMGADIAAAIARAYDAVERIHWSGAHYRRDIGRKAVTRPLQGVKGVRGK